MRLSSLHYFPLTPLFLLGLFVLAVLVAFVEVGILRYAYEQIGVARRYVFAVLAATLLGSYVNVPVAELPPEEVLSDQVVSSFGIEYVVPRVEEWPRTIVAINVGGALVPTLLALFLLAKRRLYGPGLLATAIVAVVVHTMARPVRGVGIAVPTFIPPLVAAACALALARRAAPAVAYISGSLGTLIGADLLNLGRIQGLGAPVASIGGAGTFDGVFLTGIVAVLLARTRGPERPQDDAGRGR
jgi:uncharacterized membrane protein